MLKMVQDLTRKQLDELKDTFFWQDETQDIVEDAFSNPEEIPDWMLFEYYDNVCFTDDDFFCTASNGNFENCETAYQRI